MFINRFLNTESECVVEKIARGPRAGLLGPRALTLSSQVEKNIKDKKTKKSKGQKDTKAKKKTKDVKTSRLDRTESTDTVYSGRITKSDTM